MNDDQLDLLARAATPEPKLPPKKKVPKKKAKVTTRKATDRKSRKPKPDPQPEPEQENGACWKARGSKAWELVEDGLVIAVIRDLGSAHFEWITKFAHSHAKSLEEAQGFVREELDR